MFGVPVCRQGQPASWLPVRLTWWREGRTPAGQAACLAWLGAEGACRAGQALSHSACLAAILEGSRWAGPGAGGPGRTVVPQWAGLAVVVLCPCGEWRGF